MGTKGFWDFLEDWQRIDPAGKTVKWLDGRLENDWCADCRYCCGPQQEDEPFPMGLLPEQTAGAQERFFLLDSQTAALDRRGCKSDSVHGCKLVLKERPVACGLFPIVLANGGLYLYMMCPAVIREPFATFLELGRKAGDLLVRRPLEQLRHISLWLNADTLARKYAYLHIRVFDDSGVRMILD